MHGCRSRVLSDSAASAPSRDRWRESPAAPAPDARRPSARATTAATARGSSSARTGLLFRPASGTGSAAGAFARPSLPRPPRWPRLLVLLAHAAEAGHGHEHILEPLGDLGIEGEPTLDQGFRRNLIDIGHHLLLHLVHHGGLHRRDVGQSEKLPGLQRRAIYFDVNFHDRSSCWLVAVSSR